MSEPMVLVRDAEVFAPEPLGRRDILLAGGCIVAMAARIDPGAGLYVRIVEARGRLAVPGYVDSLVHVSGGGGEGGFATRTAPLAPEQALAAGVTTLIAALGTDDVTRSHADLLACCRALAAQGLSAYALTGSYRVPVRTLTGGVREDLVLVPDIIGVGEVAIADHRGSQPTAHELARIAADARVGGLLAGKRGTVLVHVGDSADGLALLHQACDVHSVPPGQFHPTHVNRHRGLLAQAAAWTARGGSVDLTTSTSADLLAAGDVPAALALAELLRAGVPVSQVSLSSDGQASLPYFDAHGSLLGLDVAQIGSLHAALVSAVREHGLTLAQALPAFTATPAAIWGLAKKGRLAVGSDADLLLLAPGSLAVEAVFAGGACRVGG
ncbi:MAG: beta-aspartyl-peptidase [Arenimonas sp.]|nr:beta-aspartyl-peptidase [Arenimonas sp.]